MRLAHCPGAQGDNVLMGGRGVDRLAPSVRLALCSGKKSNGDNILRGTRNTERLRRGRWPALLIAWPYLRDFLRHRHAYAFRDWALDSGAFSAHNSGIDIDNERYIDMVIELQESDPLMTDAFALDVIPQSLPQHQQKDAWRMTLANTELAWKRGARVIPTYHAGEPEAFLDEIASSYPKIAIGGFTMLRTQQRKIDFARAVLERVWPKKVHGFGVASRDVMLAVPLHSVDATSWQTGPCAFGNWKTLGKMSVRGSHQNLTGEVDWYLRLEREARSRWQSEMRELESDGES